MVIRVPLAAGVTHLHVLALLAVLIPAAPAGADPPDIQRLLRGGDTAAMTAWAARFEHGEGVDRDPAKALILYCRAAWAGGAEAPYRIGWMYANGRGVERNDRLAAGWFGVAKARGDAYAARMLARLGRVAPPDNPPCLLPDGSPYLRPLESVPNPSRARIAQWVARLAPDYDLDPRLVLAVIRAESDFDPDARSSKNALGLMQITPATAKRFGVPDVWDPLENLKGGMAYLRWLLGHFDGNEGLALAGYNAGEQTVHRYGGIPPFAETRGYVKRVSRLRRYPATRLLSPGQTGDRESAGKPGLRPAPTQHGST